MPDQEIKVTLSCAHGWEVRELTSMIENLVQEYVDKNRSNIISSIHSYVL